MSADFFFKKSITLSIAQTSRKSATALRRSVRRTDSYRVRDARVLLSSLTLIGLRSVDGVRRGARRVRSRRHLVRVLCSFSSCFVLLNPTVGVSTARARAPAVRRTGAIQFFRFRCSCLYVTSHCSAAVAQLQAVDGRMSTGERQSDLRRCWYVHTALQSDEILSSCGLSN